jgi:hypothetical protein
VHAKTRKFKARFKIVSGVVGAAAAVILAVIGVTASKTPAQAQDWAQGTMQTGATVTQSTPATAPETSVATPLFTFTTPEGFAVPH